MGVTPFKIVTSVGRRETTGVPPGPNVTISVPTTIVVVAVGMGMIVVELEWTNVSEMAVGGG